jgi:ribosomal protein L11 methyltransferase
LGKYPALEVFSSEHDRLLALVDDFSPTAAQEHSTSITVFFSTPDDRNRARRAVVDEWPGVGVLDREIDDEDWARRSQEDLKPVTVGRITVAPPWAVPAPIDPAPPALPALVIAPSMGFGTGHHATTRLCLAALQHADVPTRGAEVLDLGTGSGVLAMAARLLGARRVLGIDLDVDAIRSAEENLRLNPAMNGVSFQAADIRRADLPAVDIITANLTGALLVGIASRVLGLLRPGGVAIISGLLDSERSAVLGAFAPARAIWEAADAPWLAFTLRGRRGV